MNNLLNSKLTADKIPNVSIEDSFVTSGNFDGRVEQIWTGNSWFEISFVDVELSVKTYGRAERGAMINFLMPWLERTKNFKVEDV